jgi:hypothetical protein
MLRCSARMRRIGFAKGMPKASREADILENQVAVGRH